MLFAFLIAICWAHSFDVNFYGHDIFCRLEEQKVLVSYTMEIPREQLGKDIRSFSPKEPVPKEQLREVFVTQYYNMIQSEVDLLIDGEHQPWNSSKFELFRATDDGQFGAFTVHLMAPIPADGSSLAIINSNAMGERAIFRNRVVVDSSIVVHHSDLVEREGQSILVSWNGKWNVREELREIRISYSVVGPLLRRLDNLWNAWLYQRETSYPIEQSIWQGWIQEWKNGRTSYIHFGVAIGVGILLCGVRIRRSVRLASVSALSLAALSLLVDAPWNWLSYTSWIGFGLLAMVVPSSWPLLFIVFGSIWMRPAALGIPIVLMVWIFSTRGIQIPKWLARLILCGGWVWSLTLHLWYVI